MLLAPVRVNFPCLGAVSSMDLDEPFGGGRLEVPITILRRNYIYSARLQLPFDSLRILSSESKLVRHQRSYLHGMGVQGREVVEDEELSRSRF